MTSQPSGEQTTGASAKKAALIYIYKILTEATRPLKQAEIAEILKEQYGIDLERKAIGRNLQILRDAGFDLESTRKGSYLESEFEPSEILLLVESVFSHSSVPPNFRRRLIQRLAQLSGGEYRERAEEYACGIINNHDENSEYFLTIETIEYAIGEKKKITFTYNRIGIDKKMHPGDTVTVSPVRLTMNEGHLYLLAISEDFNRQSGEPPYMLTAYRIKMITNAKKTDLDAIEPKSAGLLSGEKTIESVIRDHPDMNALSEDVTKVVFVCPERVLGRAAERFGRSLRIEELPPMPENALNCPAWKNAGMNMVKCICNATPTAIKDFIFENRPYVALLEPTDLRESLKKEIEDLSACIEALPTLIEKV